MKNERSELPGLIFTLLILFPALVPAIKVEAQQITPGLNTRAARADPKRSGDSLKFSMIHKTNSGFRLTNDVPSITRGYYFLQFVNAYYLSQFGAISTAAEAESTAAILNDHLVSGIEYGPLYFHREDMSACLAVAEAFQLKGIDLWLTSAGLQDKIRAFNNDEFPSQYRAYCLSPDGSIIPATVWSLGSPEKVPAFDSMNPDAMNWFLDRYKSVYLEPMKQYTSGYFFDEDCLFYGQDPGYQNNTRINYYELPAYSDAVLALWQKYCVDHSVTYNGEVVSKFPVHSTDMLAHGGGKTEYYPGYNVPDTIESGTDLVSLPRNTGVWAAWDDFVTTQYVESWIGGILKAVCDVNNRNSNFKGVAYFGLHDWSLAYEEVASPDFRIDPLQRWVPWGTQRGVRLSKICSLPNIKYIICETFPPIKANLYQFAAEFDRIAGEHDKIFGLMIHRDDNWGLDGSDTETDRWEMIDTFQPVIVARYPINRLFPNDQFYDEQKENLYDQRLTAYRPANPLPPTLISPVNHAGNVSNAPMLIWGNSVGAVKYFVQLSTDSTFCTLVVDDSTSHATSFRPGPLRDATTFYWRVKGKTSRGETSWSSYGSFTTTLTSVKETGTSIIKNFELTQNHPNPFNPTTTISYQLSAISFVSLKVYNVLGQEVATLVSEKQTPGTHTVEFSAEGGSASGGDGSKLASGVYFYRIQAGSFTATKKMLLVK